jgi:cell division protein FtsI (penicillin-binding protein 3)
MLARTDSRARALVLLVVVTLVAGAIGARLVWWQVAQAEWLAEMANHQLAREHELPAERGEITDRNGSVLATSVEVQSVFATPPSVEDARLTATRLSAILDLSAVELRAKLSSGQAWVWIERRVTPREAERVRELGIDGVGLLPETERVYPVSGVAQGTTLASHLIGYVDVDGRGNFGVEQAEDELLAGVPGSIRAQEDVAGRQIADSVATLQDPVDGVDLRLTVDAGVQNLLETAMWDTFRANNAKGVTGLIMNAETGAILAMASYPSYDANAYETTGTDRFSNPAIARQYEPGSVMKAFTVAAALDAGVITTSDRFLDDNNLELAGARIQNADRYNHPYGHGEITAADVLELSNNVGAAKIGLALGGTALYDAFRRFGFGTPTGIDLAGEAGGMVWSPDDASGDLTTAQNAFGQGLSLTSVQLAAGYASFANGGLLVTPHVVAGWTDADGAFRATERPAPERIMREATADTVLRMLIGAINDGIASGAQLTGYTVAGKTGTAQIAGAVNVKLEDGTTVERWQYVDGWVDSSFVGLLPNVETPLVTVILLHRPAVWGRYQMAERPETVYANLMPQVLDYLAIPPDHTTEVARP